MNVASPVLTFEYPFGGGEKMSYPNCLGLYLIYFFFLHETVASVDNIIRRRTQSACICYAEYLCQSVFLIK